MPQLRAGDAGDLPFLEGMLYEAFLWDAAAERPALATLREDPEFAKQLADWGRPGDRAVIAEEGGSPVGAAWFRLWTPEHHSYGFVDVRTPELGIAVSGERRSRGLGGLLLAALVDVARADGFPALSLSVAPANRARRLYESSGFQKVAESGTSFTLRLSL
jgi:ribosomal protein S18 acetylase RimI-like enzyme